MGRYRHTIYYIYSSEVVNVKEEQAIKLLSLVDDFEDYGKLIYHYFKNKSYDEYSSAFVSNVDKVIK